MNHVWQDVQEVQAEHDGSVAMAVSEQGKVMMTTPILNVFQVEVPMNNPLLNPNCDHLNPLRHMHHFHAGELPLSSLRETCVRERHPPVFFLFLQAKPHWHSVRVAWNLLVCRQYNGKRLALN